MTQINQPTTPKMLSLQIVSGDQSCQVDAPDESTVGRGIDCDVRLRGWDVSQHHARFFRTAAGISVEDLGGWGGVSVNGSLVQCYGPLNACDVIKVGSHHMRLVDLTEIPSHGTGQHTLSQFEPSRTLVTQSANGSKSAAPLTAFQATVEYQDAERGDSIVDSINGEVTRPLPDTIDALGPFRSLLSDRSVTKVLLNRHDEIFVERNGSLQAYPFVFPTEIAASAAVQQLLARAELRLGGPEPIIEAKLPDGTRVTAIMPPVARTGLTVLIRKSIKHELSIDDLVHLGAMSPAMAAFLRGAVESEKNILVSGTATSGKSALLRGLCDWIPMGQRILTIEDVAEFQLSSPHLVSLELGRNESSGAGTANPHALMQAALRLRPDRVILDECRGKEALPVLQSMTFRSCVWMASVPAKSSLHAMKSLQTLAMAADNNVSMHAAQELVTSAVDVLVHYEKFSCGTRKISSVAEVRREKDGTPRILERFRFDHTGYKADGKVYGEFVECSPATSPGFIP